MTIGQHATEMNGKRIVEFSLGGKLENLDATVPAIRIEYDSEHSIMDMFMALMQDPNVDQISGLVLGMWDAETTEDPPQELLEAVVAAAPRLPHLNSLFVGDITYEESEISWIEQGDMSAIWEAFPKLEYFRVRGSNGLSLGKVSHANLKSLIVECGGLPKSLLKEVCSVKAPLEYLEVYLGTDNYGWDGTIDDLQPLLSGDLFPDLKYLGIRDSEIADEVAVAAAKAPILARLKELDLSLGTLTDVGGKALLESEAVRSLEKLTLHHHFLSDEVAKQLGELPIAVDVGDKQTADEYDGEIYRYVAVSE